MKKGETEKALQLAEQGLKYELTEAQGAELNRVAAEVLCRKGELKRAQTYAKKARTHALASGDYRILYSSAVALGNIFARKNNYAAADMAYNEALTLAGIHKDTRLEGPVLLNMAQLDQHRGNHIRALDILNKVRGRLEKTKEQRLLAVCYSRMAFSYMEENRLKEALSSVKELEELAEQKGDKSLMASAHFRRGSVYLKQDEFPKALPEFQESSEIYKELGDIKNLAIVICDLARVYINLGKVRKANSLLKEATASAQKIDSENVLCKIKIILADKAVLRGSWGQARGFYEEALTKAEAIDNEDRLHYLHKSLGKTVEKMGFNLPGLESLLKRALESYVRLGLKREAEETQRWLAQISLTE